MFVIEQPIPPAPPAHSTVQELKSMFEKQARVERFDLIQTFHAYKQEKGKPVSPYVIKIKGYVKQLEHLGYVLPQDLSVGLIMNGLTSDFAGFDATPQVMAIQGGRIQKANKKSLNAKGKGKGKGKGKDKPIYIPKPQNLKPSAKEHQTKDDACHHCKEVGHQKRNYPAFLAELIKKKKQVGIASSSKSRNKELSIYEIDMLNLVLNVNSVYNVSNKRAKYNLDSTYMWHCCLTHISKKRIEKLQQDGLLKSTDEESVEQCVSCLSGMMTRKLFLHRIERATDLLGLIHTDVCGPLRHVSRQGASYFITFTDDYSRYGYVYLLKHKHEVFERFKVFKNEVENQLEKTIKALRSDRGGEYISQKFKDYLNACGIVQQFTPPYTPQHNDVSERKNRTLLYMVQSMMNLTTLLLSFWDYALESATRILNIVPTKKALVKRDMSDKLQQRSVKFVARYAEFLEKNIISQEVSGRVVELKEIQDKDTSSSENTSKIPIEVEGFEPPQEEVVPVRRLASAAICKNGGVTDWYQRHGYREQAYDATDNELPIPLLQAPIAPPTVVSPSPVLSLSPMFDSRDLFPPEVISLTKDIETPVESPIPISPSSSIGSSSPVRSTTPPPDYPFDKSIFAELENSLWIIPRPLGSKPVPVELMSQMLVKMPPKRTSTSAALAMAQAAI
ncbi:retrotransposon protein, putative, ty1-copia subclass [Tanacetum coccineum]